MKLTKTQKAYVELIELNGEVGITRDDSLFAEFMKIVKKGGFKVAKEDEKYTYFAAW